MGDTPPVLKVTEVAELLRKSPRWVRQQIAAGEISATRIGGSVFVLRSTIDDILAGRIS